MAYPKTRITDSENQKSESSSNPSSVNLANPAPTQNQDTIRKDFLLSLWQNILAKNPPLEHLDKNPPLEHLDKNINDIITKNLDKSDFWIYTQIYKKIENNQVRKLLKSYLLEHYDWINFIVSLKVPDNKNLFDLLNQLEKEHYDTDTNYPNTDLSNASFPTNSKSRFFIYFKAYFLVLNNEQRKKMQENKDFGNLAKLFSFLEENIPKQSDRYFEILSIFKNALPTETLKYITEKVKVVKINNKYIFNKKQKQEIDTLFKSQTNSNKNNHNTKITQKTNKEEITDPSPETNSFAKLSKKGEEIMERWNEMIKRSKSVKDVSFKALQDSFDKLASTILKILQNDSDSTFLMQWQLYKSLGSKETQIGKAQHHYFKLTFPEYIDFIEFFEALDIFQDKKANINDFALQYDKQNTDYKSERNFPIHGAVREFYFKILNTEQQRIFWKHKSSASTHIFTKYRQLFQAEQKLYENGVDLVLYQKISNFYNDVKISSNLSKLAEQVNQTIKASNNQSNTKNQVIILDSDSETNQPIVPLPNNNSNKNLLQPSQSNPADDQSSQKNNPQISSTLKKQKAEEEGPQSHNSSMVDANQTPECENLQELHETNVSQPEAQTYQPMETDHPTQSTSTIQSNHNFSGQQQPMSFNNSYAPQQQSLPFNNSYVQQQQPMFFNNSYAQQQQPMYFNNVNPQLEQPMYFNNFYTQQQQPMPNNMVMIDQNVLAQLLFNCLPQGSYVFPSNFFSPSSFSNALPQQTPAQNAPYQPLNSNLASSQSFFQPTAPQTTSANFNSSNMQQSYQPSHYSSTFQNPNQQTNHLSPNNNFNQNGGSDPNNSADSNSRYQSNNSFGRNQ